MTLQFNQAHVMADGKWEEYAPDMYNQWVPWNAWVAEFINVEGFKLFSASIQPHLPGSLEYCLECGCDCCSPLQPTEAPRHAAWTQ